jgi:hypothetical protein
MSYGGDALVEEFLIMPNGVNPPPPLDVHDVASLGHYLGWMGQATYSNHEAAVALDKKIEVHLVWAKEKSELLNNLIKEREKEKAVNRTWKELGRLILTAMIGGGALTVAVLESASYFNLIGG